MNYNKGILIAFGELFLKSDSVRKIFQRRLVNNLRFFLKKEKVNFKIVSSRERIFIKTNEIKKTSQIIKRVFGIVLLAESFYFNNLKDFLSFIDKNYQDYIKEGETFAIRMKKDRKIINRIAKNIDRRVNLNKPKRELFVEKRDENYFLYFKKIKCLGGLPLGSSGKVLCLMSGGIDSPPAAFLTAKRGGENIWLHFHSFPLVSNSSIEKVKELAKVFLRYQTNLKILFVPFQRAQLEIKAKAPAKYRVLLYRRFMFKIAEKIARKENCQALVTGESLGQVSSQTLDNIEIIEQGVKIPVLRPLIGWDKQEIITLAKKIKTYNISIKPQEDCCTLFVPKHQTANGNIETIKKIEKKLNYKFKIKELSFLKLT